MTSWSLYLSLCTGAPNSWHGWLYCPKHTGHKTKKRERIWVIKLKILPTIVLLNASNNTFVWNQVNMPHPNFVSAEATVKLSAVIFSTPKMFS